MQVTDGNKGPILWSWTGPDVRAHLEKMKEVKAKHDHLKASGLNVISPSIASTFDPELLITLIEFDDNFTLDWEEAQDDEKIKSVMEKMAEGHRKEAPDLKNMIDKTNMLEGKSTSLKAQLTVDVFKNMVVFCCGKEEGLHCIL